MKFTAETLRKMLEPKLERQTNGCLEFTGSRDRDGYGILSQGWYKAHRAAWEIKNGPVPEGLHVLHQCDNPPCCDPEHLFIGTVQDNVDDMQQKGRAKYWTRGRTHCIHGHEFTPENIAGYTDPPKPGSKKKCLECNRIRCREYQKKRRAQRKADLA